jgi:hypothetical protein
MKIKNKKSFSLKKLLIPAIVLVLIGGGAYAYALSNNFFEQSAENAQTTESESPNDPVPEGLVPSDEINKEDLGEDTSMPEGETKVIITAASVSGDVLQVRALIQSVSTEGTCVLSLARDGVELYSESAEVQAGPSTTACRGFDSNIGSLTPGAVSLMVTYVNNGVTSNSDTRTIQIE